MLGAPMSTTPSTPSGKVHREEARFVVSIELTADFDEDYEGDDDGYAWLARWRAAVQPRLARAVFEQLRADPSFDAVPVSRGKNPEDEIEIAVRFRASAAPLRPGAREGGSS
jgi:hypothetical protein